MGTSDHLLDVVQRHLDRAEDGVWTIAAGAPMRRFIEELSAGTEKHVVSLNPGNFAVGESMSKGAVWDERDLLRGISHKTVVGAPRNFSSDDRQYCAWLTGLGAEVRWNPACATRLILADSAMALLRANPAEPRSDCTGGDESGPAGGLSGPVRLAVDERPAAGGGLPGRAHHDEVDQELLTLLAAGATDAQVARALDMSPRQVGRRIARLATELDAVGRFALGAAAQRRGWLA